MKNFFLLFTAFLGISYHAQEFVLTPDNFKDKANLEKNYVVIEVPNKSKHEIYLATKKFVNSYYKNPKFVTTDVEDEQIIINAVGHEFKVIYQLSGANLWRMRYQFEIQFRDSKLMFKPSFVELENTMNANTVSLIGGGMLSTGMFNKKRTVNKENGIIEVEKDVNVFISDLNDSIKKSNNQEW